MGKAPLFHHLIMAEASWVGGDAIDEEKSSRVSFGAHTLQMKSAAEMLGLSVRPAGRASQCCCWSGRSAQAKGWEEAHFGCLATAGQVLTDLLCRPLKEGRRMYKQPNTYRTGEHMERGVSLSLALCVFHLLPWGGG